MRGKSAFGEISRGVSAVATAGAEIAVSGVPDGEGA